MLSKPAPESEFDRDRRRIKWSEKRELANAKFQSSPRNGLSLIAYGLLASVVGGVVLGGSRDEPVLLGLASLLLAIAGAVYLAGVIRFAISGIHLRVSDLEQSLAMLQVIEESQRQAETFSEQLEEIRVLLAKIHVPGGRN